MAKNAVVDVRGCKINIRRAGQGEPLMFKKSGAGWAIMDGKGHPDICPDRNFLSPPVQHLADHLVRPV